MVKNVQIKRKHSNILIIIQYKLLYCTIFYQAVKSNFVQK